MSDQPKASSNHRRTLRLLLLGGALIVLSALTAAGWMSGYLKPKEKVALVTWNQNPYWDVVIQGAKDASHDWNVDLSIVRSEPDEKSQSQHVRDLISQGVAIAICPNNPTVQADLLNDTANKIVLVTFDSDADAAKRRAFVGTNNLAAGQDCADEVRRAIPDGGAIIISVGSIDMQNARERRQGLIDNLLERHAGKSPTADSADATLVGPKYSIVATVVDGGDTAKAASAIADAIKARSETKCIVGLFSYSAPAAVKAIDQTGKKGQIKIIGFDESDETQAGIEAGTIFSSILQDQYRCGYEAVNLMVDGLRGFDKEGPAGARSIHLPTSVITADNIATLREKKMIHQPGAVQ